MSGQDYPPEYDEPEVEDQVIVKGRSEKMTSCDDCSQMIMVGDDCTVICALNSDDEWAVRCFHGHGGHCPHQGT